MMLHLPVVPPLHLDAATDVAERRTGNTAVTADNLGIVEGWETFGEPLSETAGSFFLRGWLATLELSHSVSAQPIG